MGDRGNFQRKRKAPLPQAQPEGSGEIFEAFKCYAVTLDDINDRYERIVKLSRDITIASKRLIFLLHRSPDAYKEQAQQINDDLSKIYENFHKIMKEIEGQEYWRYQRAFSPGLQEFIEAVSFLQFLHDGTLLGLNKVQEMIAPAGQSPSAFTISFGDYIQGIADLTGELMRVCVTSASNGNRDLCFKILDFMRVAKTGFKALPNAFLFSNKIEVLEQSLKKVEQVCFKITIQAKEFPDINFQFSDQGEEIEAS